MADKRTIEIEVLRYNPEKDAEPHFQSFQVPFTDDVCAAGPAVHQGPPRRQPHLPLVVPHGDLRQLRQDGERQAGASCHTFLRDYYPGKLRIEPLNHFPIVRDLVIDQSDFLKKLESVKPYIVPREEKDLKDGEYLQTPSQLHEYYQYSQCINCLLCYAACPQYGLKPSSPGPRRSRCCTATTPTRATAAGKNARSSSTPRRRLGLHARAPRCARSTSTPRAINQNKVNSTMDYFGVRNS